MNNIGSEACGSIAKVIETNEKLTSLYLGMKVWLMGIGFNCIGSGGAKILAEALRKSTTLLKLAISTLLLQVDGNELRAEGAKCLAEMLKANCHLEELYAGACLAVR